MSSELIYGVFQRIQGGLHGAQRLLTARGWTARCGRNRCSAHSSRRRGRRSDSRPWLWRLRRGCPGKCRHRRRKRISLHVHVPDRGRDRLLQRRELLVEQGVGGVGGPASASAGDKRSNSTRRWLRINFLPITVSHVRGGGNRDRPVCGPRSGPSVRNGFPASPKAAPANPWRFRLSRRKRGL